MAAYAYASGVVPGANDLGAVLQSLRYILLGDAATQIEAFPQGLYKFRAVAEAGTDLHIANGNAGERCLRICLWFGRVLSFL
jgi:hypothetical protein